MQPPAKPKAQTTTHSSSTKFPPLPLLGEPTQSHTPAMRRVQESGAKKIHTEKRYDLKDTVKKGGGFPTTSAAEIGWRCKQLEGYGIEQLQRRKKSFRKTLNWPRQEWPHH